MRNLTQITVRAQRVKGYITLSLLQHEDASLTMFDHMVEVNNLRPSFARYKLTKKDMIFIKELIIGTPQGENQYKVFQEYLVVLNN